MMNLFGGYLCSPKNITTFWKFLYYLVPTHYLLEGLTMTQFHGDNRPVELIMPVNGVHTTTVEQWVINRFGGFFSYSHRWIDIAVLLLYILCLRIGTFLALSYVRHINR
jgi:hypothetical protein